MSHTPRYPIPDLNSLPDDINLHQRKFLELARAHRADEVEGSTLCGSNLWDSSVRQGDAPSG